MLPFIEQTQIYNALNFNWGSEDSTTVLCYQINSTGTDRQISTFVCPSDPNAGKPDHNNTTNTNNYYACVGTTMNFSNITDAMLPMVSINWPSTGLFTFQQSYGIRDCIDGTSNTIAFAEAVVGTQSLQFGQRRIGFNTVTALVPSMLLDAQSNPTLAVAGLNACSAVWTKRSGGNVDDQRGQNWSHGCLAMTLFNTIATPNLYDDEWTHCSAIGSTARAAISNSDSYHPGGVNVCMADGSVKFIKDAVNQRTWWALGTRAGGEVISSDSY
jgi:prepilin-type processing-associated H-X9-DG protein